VTPPVVDLHERLDPGRRHVGLHLRLPLLGGRESDVVAQAVQLDTGMSGPRHVSSVIALYRGQTSGAVEDARRALQIWPQNTLMLAMVRNEALERGDFAGARTIYDHA
jgi:hypothetical protein